MRKVFRVQAPSNVALIKYMGKKDFSLNIPYNSSLSYTLENFFTCVEITESQKNQDHWKPLKKKGLYPISLSQTAQKRFLKHFQFLKEHLGIKGVFTVSSANNFPSDCGLASSASSFAALTACVNEMLEKKLDPLKLARLSQRSSGSSCRSFFSPWVLWQEKSIKPLNLPELEHSLILVNSQKKHISSSQAHRRVLTSPFYPQRVDSTQKRIQKLIECLKKHLWQEAFHICWDEFEDMHQLFETSYPAFSYKTSKTRAILKEIKKRWNQLKDGPLVTMDAGPNIHLLWRKNSPHKDSFYFKP